MDKVDGKKLKI